MTALLAAASAVLAVVAVGLAMSVRSRQRELDRLRRQLATLESARSEVPSASVVLVRAVAGPAVVFDGDGYLVAHNEAARGVFGISHRDEPRQTVLQVTGNRSLADEVRAARDERPREVRDLVIGERVVDAVVAVVGDEVMVTVRDRSEQRRVDDLRRNFVANASHELKTPAAAIQSLTDGLQLVLHEDPDHAARVVGQLHREAERLSRIVHDLLSLRRLEEPTPVVGARVDLAVAARAVVADLHQDAEDRQVAVAVDAPTAVPVAADAADVDLLLRNLVGNAIQYNVAGGRVDVRIVAGAGVVTLTVTDDGLGIPERDLDRVFERFYRVDVARSRDRGGTGLGLAIARHAAERNGGAIRVQSLLGAGSTFTVELRPAPSDDVVPAS